MHMLSICYILISIVWGNSTGDEPLGCILRDLTKKNWGACLRG